ncbi:MAG TPA: signal peptide peptidase SppA [Syntrophomonadaceae bacterium]|nr:signal peptide peptidase SppA [Syntrophomonadaceae bacterium]HOQ08550.1 signal peptide peptidase SppA [Syntrophomonadaceae bacterium]HPU49006.1 signal peptide peptidase SppA [Syntrophomonadaceae bacterium]
MNKKLVVGVLVLFLAVMTIVSLWGITNAGGRGKLAGGSAIGVIEINGVISGETGGGLLSGYSANAMDIMESIRQAREREDIKAVVLRIDSPGGSAVASQEIALELDRLRQEGKKVITSMGDMCTSGGYWIACSSDYIMANGATLTGSIGVIMQLSNLEGLYEKLGIKEEVIKSGKHKDMGSATRTLTEEERRLLEDIVGDSYDQFLDQVLKGRSGKISREKLLEVADGRIISGRQALELGLVDGIGNYYDALDKARETAGLPEDSPVEILNGIDFWKSLGLSVLGELSEQVQGRFIELRYQ